MADLPSVIRFSLLNRNQPDRKPLVPYVIKQQVFSRRECDYIRSFQRDESVWKPFVNRPTDTCTYPREWEYVTTDETCVNRVDEVVREVNAEHWQLDLVGQYMHPRLLQYKRGHNMAPHVDYQPHCGEQDKLCAILLLSDRSEYSGGDLYMGDYMEKPLRLNKGDMVFFPTYVLHYVTRVKKGLRISMTFWTWGPHFR